MKKNKICILIIFFIVWIGICPIVAEQIQSPNWGYVLDLPEGFILTATQGTDNYQFEHSMIPVTLIITSYPQERYATAKQTMQTSYEKLGARGDIEEVQWRNTTAVLGYFEMTLDGQEYTGWGVAVALPDQIGITLMLAYSPSAYFAQYEQLIISAIDSLSIDRGSLYETGIITAYAYPSEGDENITVRIDNKTIPIVLDKSDTKANTFIVEREYAVLSFFANTPLWKEAWQRFYRMIYRDSYKRLEKTSFAIFNALYEDTKQDFPLNPDLALAQKLLSWTQGFKYERYPLGTDFTPLPATLTGAGSDCDSRALLLAVLMAQMNYKTMLFVSAEYSHALFGIEIEGPGARMAESGINYLLGETTAPVNMGLVPEDMSDESKWISIKGL